ncbi:MAG TPA: class I SAM-dependent methyltransferase [Candidatus Paceibacterota bacterium]
MDLRSTYNKIAEDWFKDHHQDTWWQEGTEKFLEALPTGSTILDVGCGAGVKSRYLAKKGFKVTGIDFSEKMIEIAKRESPEISFDVVDVYEIDKYPKTFDGVFAQAVLLHIPKDKIREVLSKLKNKINSNGLLYIAVKGMRDDGVEEAIKKEDDYGYEYERFFSFFNLSELENYLKELDMEVVWKTNTTSGRADWLQIVGRKSK